MTSPGLFSLPALPETCCKSWKVFSDALKSPPERLRSASIIPTNVRFFKLCPFDIIWVPIIIFTFCVSTSNKNWLKLFESLSVSDEIIDVLESGNLVKTSSSSLSTPGPHEVKQFFSPHFEQSL